MRSHLRYIVAVMLVAACSQAGVDLAGGSRAVAAGTALYVSPSGDDANPGTEAEPFRTLTRGVRDLAPGGTLYLREGVYEESLVDDIPSGTSWGAPVTVAAYPGERPVLRPAAGQWVLHFVAPQRYIVVDGLVVDGHHVRDCAVKITASSRTGPAHHIRFVRTEVMNSPGSGFLVTEDARDNQFIDLDVHDNGDTRYDHGFYISTPGNLVEGSRIHDNSGWGVHVYTDGTYETLRADHNTVRGNVISGNGIGEGGFGIILSSGRGNAAYNNVLVGNEAGIQVAYFRPRGTKIVNNTVVGSRQYGIYVARGARRTLVRNNIVTESGWQNLKQGGDGFVADHNLLGGDPGFADPASGDYRPAAGSPAVDAGAASDLVTADLAGTPRPQGLARDIGAFERPGADPPR